jgi:hypothetical protein
MGLYRCDAEIHNPAGFITSPNPEELNPWESQEHLFDEAARELKLSPGMTRVLREPNKEIILHIPVQMDSGDLEVFAAYRVQRSIARGYHRHSGSLWSTRPGRADRESP